MFVWRFKKLYWLAYSVFAVSPVYLYTIIQNMASPVVPSCRPSCINPGMRRKPFLFSRNRETIVRRGLFNLSMGCLSACMLSFLFSLLSLPFKYSDNTGLGRFQLEISCLWYCQLGRWGKQWYNTLKLVGEVKHKVLVHLQEVGDCARRILRTRTPWAGCLGWVTASKQRELPNVGGEDVMCIISPLSQQLCTFLP